MAQREAKDLTVTVPDSYTEASGTPRASLLSRLAGDREGRRNVAVLGLFLLSALIMTMARVLAPFEVGKDQAVQIEAAHRLASGLGLTTTNQQDPPAHDLSEPPRPARLTQWPPGFSVIIASFLSAGVPLLASLKIVYALATLIGWLGWALIASALASEPLRLGSRSFPVHYLIAALAPIFTTPLWEGTDVFLWGGIPFLVLLLNRSSSDRHAYLKLVGAGLLFGYLCSMRYASAFLALAAVFILIQVSYPGIKLALKRLLVFLSPSLVMVLLVVAYLKLSPHSLSGMPAQLNVSAEGPGLFAKVLAIVNGSSVTSNLIFGFPLLDQTVTAINFKPLNYSVGIACLLLVFGLPLIVARNRASDTLAARADLALSLSFLPLSLTAFLIITRLLSDSSLYKIRRYYEPLILCGILIFYALASRRATHRMVRAAAASVVTLFVAYLLLFNAALLVLPGRRAQLVESVLSFTLPNNARQHSTSQPIGYPSWRLYTWKESSRLKVKQLYDAHPDALFIAQEYPLYIYDMFRAGGPVPGVNLIDYQGNYYLGQAYTSRAIKVFWLLSPEAKLDFLPESQMKLIYSDPIEKTNIYESDLPAGYRLGWAGGHMSALLRCPATVSLTVELERARFASAPWREPLS